MNYQININDVMSVYSGENGMCCCGCAGKHTYASKYRKIASKDRGYRVDDEEISDRTVKLIVNKMNKYLTIPGNKPNYTDKKTLKELVSIVRGERLYIAYLLKEKN
jgi:hypothetical protein